VATKGSLGDFGSSSLNPFGFSTESLQIVWCNQEIIHSQRDELL
jgi:hypothetical protein